MYNTVMAAIYVAGLGIALLVLKINRNKGNKK